jgi:hypothetical protein
MWKYHKKGGKKGMNYRQIEENIDYFIPKMTKCLKHSDQIKKIALNRPGGLNVVSIYLPALFKSVSQHMKNKDISRASELRI